MTYAEIQSALISDYKIRPLEVKASVQSLFDYGFIDEMYSVR